MTRFVLQLHFDAANRIGPGKIDLLEQIERTGSISAAGRTMNMSYRRAWLLVDALNQTFHAPVVATRLGGTSAGRAWLTPLGREVVQLYREIGEVARDAANPRINRLEQLIAEGARRPSPGGPQQPTVPTAGSDTSRSVIHAGSGAGKPPTPPPADEA
jgi:molybdate transport system regulatory protein